MAAAGGGTAAQLVSGPSSSSSAGTIIHRQEQRHVPGEDEREETIPIVINQKFDELYDLKMVC